MNNRIFALDIGTRSVTGILLTEQDGVFTLIDLCTIEHKERSMIDGQIHDVVSVAQVIREVKETLEDTHGPLQHVSVAAAGRALKTVKATASASLDHQPITNKDQVKHLELRAVQQALEKVMKQKETDRFSHYACVGYSTLAYTLDGEPIRSLIDQYGKTAAVEVIATFLPKVVVESLISAIQRAGLQMRALTLEPIAAIHVLIPESMRRLNVALIDIGAGTSDIALTKQGSIVAYGMVPHAGDKITEAISDAYILDFPQAEQAKKDIVTYGETLITDILGFQTTVTMDDLIIQIEEQINALATTLSHTILELNGKAPQAIMLIGGGSLTPHISKKVAERIGLPEDRVAVRGINGIDLIKPSEKLPTGPDYVTPISIAITSIQNPVHYMHVSLNNSSIRMFEMKELTIGDALVQAGIDLKKMYGKPGLALFITVNGKNMTLPGHLGTTPEIVLNGNDAQIHTPIQQSDAISVQPGTDGASVQMTVTELIGQKDATPIMYHNKWYELSPQVYVNGIHQRSDYIVQDRDQITIKQVKTVRHFLESIDEERSTSGPFTLFVNNNRVHIEQGNRHFLVNGTKITEDYVFRANDVCTIRDATPVRVQDVLDHLHIHSTSTINVTFNEEQIQISKQIVEVAQEHTVLSLDTIIQRDTSITVKDKQKEPFTFQDIFRYVEIDLTNKTGAFSLQKNGQEATFFEPLSEGDELHILWKN